ncbi:beta-alanyl-dopamine/carcinine hydrolase-like [Ptychodera flava]|uniref:beta-alanyl-dopamine/carcinine hydrolase-like n=1 Tax=Ptychodera flava TaxID=63121 RepID=UPI003969F4B1
MRLQRILALLICVCWCTCNIKGLSLPVIYTKGTHYEVGHDIGSTFKSRIGDFYGKYTVLHDVLLPYYHTAKGRDVYDGFLNVTNSTFPQLIDELQGIADGAGQPFYHVFLLEIRTEIQLLKRKLPEPSCTDIALNFVDQKTSVQWTIQAHNEDADPLIKDYGYIIDAHIIDPTGHYPEEKFTAFSYPGILPGNAFGFNSAGMIFSINAVFPVNVVEAAIPRYITNRMLLGAKSVDEVFQIINKYSSSSGFNINFGNSMMIPGNQMLYNVEVGPGSQDYSNFTIPLANNKDDGHFYHFNMYQHTNVSQYNDTSTQHRSARAGNLPIPGNLKEIFNILGDTADSEYPIYRDGKGKDHAATVVTGVFDLINFNISIYVDNPKTSQGPVIVFPLPKKAATEESVYTDNKLYFETNNIPFH